MALETWARCASWLGNNRTLLTCCHCLIINNNNYHARHSAHGFSKHLSCDGWKCSWVPGPRATQPQGAPHGLRFPGRCSRYLQPAGLCWCCRTQRPAGCSASIAPHSSSLCPLQAAEGDWKPAGSKEGSGQLQLAWPRGCIVRGFPKWHGRFPPRGCALPLPPGPRLLQQEARGSPGHCTETQSV